MKNTATLFSALALCSYDIACNDIHHAMPGPKCDIGEGRVRVELVHFIGVNAGSSVPISRGSPPLFLSR